jgi:hypothetical protein
MTSILSLCWSSRGPVLNRCPLPLVLSPVPVPVLVPVPPGFLRPSLQVSTALVPHDPLFDTGRDGILALCVRLNLALYLSLIRQSWPGLYRCPPCFVPVPVPIQSMTGSNIAIINGSLNVTSLRRQVPAPSSSSSSISDGRLWQREVPTAGTDSLNLNDMF